MKIGKLLVGVGLAAGLTGAANAQVQGWEQYLDQVRIKQAIADTLTPAQLEERRIRLAQWMAERAAAGPPVPSTGGDACPAATYETGTFPFNASDTTAGRVDDYDLPADTTNPTCAAATTCTGAGPAGSLPRGAIYTGTGTGPDFAYKIRTTANCTLSITVDPTGTEDLAAVVYQTQCSSALADCGCVDDTGVGGDAEIISLDAVAGTDYFVSADGYSAGATPPGPAGPFTVAVTVTSGTCALDGGASADLSITKTDGTASVAAGGSTTYTIVASNAGPSPVTGATVADTFPAACTSVNWTCVGAGGGTCTAAGSGNISDATNLPSGGSVTYTATCAISGAASGSLANTATVTTAGGVVEINPANNTATDTDTIVANLPPVFAYTPASPGGTVNFTGGTTVGSTGTGTITVSIGTSGVGTGAASTTTTTCTAPTAPFAGFGQTVTAEGAGPISGGPLTGTCVLAAAAANQTLTCTENQGGTPVTRTFDLSCPAGTAVPLTSNPVSGSTVTVPAQVIGGLATTSDIVFSNPGLAAANVVCTAPAAPEFTVAPLNFSVPASGTASTTITFSSAVIGTFTSVLNCTAGAQNFTFNLSGTTGAPARAVPVSGTGVRTLLTLATLAFGLIALGLYSRRS
jgi:uncharacterized repeat protein (TIGR01451 family)